MLEWEETHKQLQAILNQEIVLRQEILSTLNQQEHMLLIGDINIHQKQSIESPQVIYKLKLTIKKRGVLTRFILEGFENSKEKKLEEVLDFTNDVESETLFLYQKVQNLIEKIQEKRRHLKTLFDSLQREGSQNQDPYQFYKKTLVPQKKKLPSLATLEYPNQK